MEEILYQLKGSLSMFIPLLTRFYTSQVVQDFFHQPYHVSYQVRPELSKEPVRPALAELETDSKEVLPYAQPQEPWNVHSFCGGNRFENEVAKRS